MTEYIKKQEVIDELMDYTSRWFAYDPYNKIVARIFQDMELTIKGIPSINAIEPKHGKWIEMYRNGFGNMICMCSTCNFHATKSNFCPNCGADMRERESE